MALFTYLLQDVLSQNVLGTVNLTSVTFNDPIGAAGSFTGTFTLQLTGDAALDAAQADFAQLSFCPDQTLIHCVWPATNEIISTYLLVSYTWDPSQNQIVLTGTQLSAWLSECYPENLVLPYTFTNVDQFAIGQVLISQLVAMGPGNGVPDIIAGNSVSGVTTSFTLTSTYQSVYSSSSYTSYQSDINTLITQIAQNYQGFDWEIYADWNSDGIPQLYLGQYYPEKSTNEPTEDLDLYFYSSPDGSNLLNYWPFPMDASYRYNNIQLSSTNTAGQTLGSAWLDGRFGSDLITPQSQGGETLGFTNTFTPLRRTYVGGPSTTNYAANTLGGLAATMGVSWSQSCGAPILTHNPATPGISVGDYNVGDRCRVRISDPFMDFDMAGVRVVDRAITDEQPGTVATVAVTLDLTDTNNPADNA